MPALAVRLLEGDLGEISPAWKGWRLAQGLLVSPEGVTWTPPRLTAWAYERQLLDELRRQAKAQQIPLIPAAVL